jgi:hypothetical protein
MWLQPGAEDDAVIKFIQDEGLDERCIYRTHALHDHTPAPTRTRSKPEPLSTSTNLPPNLVETAMVVNPVIDLTGGPCIFAADTIPTQDAPVANVAPKPVEAIAVETKAAEIVLTMAEKKDRFRSAPKFAVVGASTNSSKNGYKARTILQTPVCANRCLGIQMVDREAQGRGPHQ